MSSFYDVFLNRCEQGGLLYNGSVTDEQLKIVEHSGFFLNEVGEENFKKVADDLHHELCVYNFKRDRKVSEVIPLTEKNAKKETLDKREKDIDKVKRFIKFIEEKNPTTRKYTDSVIVYFLHKLTKKFLKIVSDEERSTYLKTPAQNKNGLKSLMAKIITTYKLQNFKTDATCFINNIPLKSQ